jgi:1,4-alpha-glucan branching enzyme
MRRFALVLSMLLLAAAVHGCSTMTFVKKRLPPPTVTNEGVIFRFNAPSAKAVQVAGNWPENDWLRGQAQSGSWNVGLMTDPDGDGIWTRTEKIPAGRYQYKFVIDQVNWKEDPNNPNRTNDGYGGNNSIIDVR